MTNREAINQFRQSQNYSGYTSDDTALTDREIYHILIQERARFYNQSSNLKTAFNEKSYQSIPCIKLREVDISTCPFNPDTGCVWLESEEYIPSFIKVKSITTDIGHNLSHRAWNNKTNLKRSRVNSAKKGRYYTFKPDKKGTRLYVLNDIFIKTVSGEFILEDPLEGIAFCDPKEAFCNPLDQEFFSSFADFEVILKLALDSYLRILQMQRPDLLNNDRKD